MTVRIGLVQGKRTERAQRNDSIYLCNIMLLVLGSMHRSLGVRKNLQGSVLQLLLTAQPQSDLTTARWLKR